MLFYILLFLMLFLILMLAPNLKNKDAEIVYKVLVVFMTALAVFRNNIGLDYYEYQKLYDIVQFDIDNLRIEPVFSLICELLRYFDFKSQMMFAVYAVATMFFIYKGCNYYSKGNYRVGLIFIAVYFLNNMFWLGSLNLIRQFLAIAIVFYASKYIFECKSKKFITWTAVAALCHYSALIALSFYLINKIDIKRKTCFIVALSLIFLSESGIYALIFEKIFLMLGDKLGAYQIYFTTVFMRDSFLQGGSGLGVMLQLSVYLFIALIADMKDQIQKFAVNGIFMGVIIWIIFCNVDPMLRFRLYYWIFFPLIIAFNLNTKFSLKKILCVYSVVAILVLSISNINSIQDIDRKKKQDIWHNTNTNIEYEFTADFIK